MQISSSRKEAQQQDERFIFERLAALAGMRIVPDSIRQNDPPAPDIECEVEGLGPIAVELVALDARYTRMRRANMRTACAAWERALPRLSASQQARLRAECEDVFLSLLISNDAGTRDRTELMHKIQKEILTKPRGFKGDLFGPPDFPHGLSKATMHRGGVTNGPRISCPSVGSVLQPQLEMIEEKLSRKTYRTSAPLELFAYSTHDEVDAHVNSMQLIDECVRKHLPSSAFRRVRVFDYGIAQQLKYSYPP